MKHKFVTALLSLVVCFLGSAALGQEATETDSVALPEPPRPMTDLAAKDTAGYGNSLLAADRLLAGCELVLY